jgi:uncharacterized protein (TIGR02996 family)
MLTDRDALLSGIAREPSADLPRLVFADWLEETGHPASVARAEYIRTAIEEANSPRVDNSRKERLDRIAVLRDQFRDEWDEFVRDAKHLHLPELIVSRRRGFVECLGVPLGLLPLLMLPELPITPLMELQILMPSQPRPVSGTGIRNDLQIWQELSQSPKLNTLDAIRFGPGLRTESYSWYSIADLGTSLGEFFPSEPESGFYHILLTSGQLINLKHLSFVNCNLGDMDIIRLIGALRRSVFLRQLESLDLSQNPISVFGANTLAAAEWPECFAALSIADTQIDTSGRERLHQRFGFDNLRPRLAMA